VHACNQAYVRWAPELRRAVSVRRWTAERAACEHSHEGPGWCALPSGTASPRRACAKAAAARARAGHWVAQDNPDGLFEIMAPSFGAQPDLHMQRASMLSPRARSLA